MRLQHYLLIFLLLFFSTASLAQQLPPKVEQLKESIAEAKQLLAQLKEQRERLRSLQAALQDSAALEQALDSLQQQYASPQELEMQEDSLKLAFADHQQALLKLDEAEARLREEIARATETLAKPALPEEASEALEKLKQASKQSAKAMLPSQQLLEKLPQELPAPQELQGMARERALKAAGDHFAGHKDKLREGRRELDKYKGRFEKVESVKDMPKGLLKLNPLKGKPWQERVVLGTHWQFGNQERFLIDLGPYAAWRFTDKISAGAGFQYRLSVSVKEKPWVSASDKTLGYFAFSEVEVLKGFFARLHYESLSTPVPSPDATGKVEQVEHEWVKGLSVGVGRNYTFFKQIQGFALMQYNLLHEQRKTPYLKPLQAKIGFYINGGSLRTKK
ncbi:hypothetical protein CLV24_1473 [Pontibacter ummariensis]|uniref:Outer membrane protein beta-barrel domain-containing protein n=1 Tax=Pontibacter ummariensis TaxID=1610492 RepID=A0A239LKD6_9BACT|nr:hypothetical protein [Pontibacter ummariensis]PRY02750.1 hypothetical protein CLV24_1473 [Pontibacter ummariensis]SNT31036.1 hypothetical protein SAMN06296052_14412 [Pontibacter ummariensis]